MKFRKGQLTKESYRVIMFDLEALYGLLKKHADSDDLYHYELLRDNLKDLYGKKVVKAVEREEEK